MTASQDSGDPQVWGTGFRAIRGGGASARFGAAQAALLRNLVSQVADLVGRELKDAGQGSGPAAAGVSADDLEHLVGLSDSITLPDDPVLARLLPDAYPDDPQAAGEFRRYTEHGLRAGKVACAETVLATLPAVGGRIRLDPEQAQAWLRSLNDVRLALGVSLQVTEDREEMLERAAAGPQAAGLWIYDWLTLLQETLVEALSS